VLASARGVSAGLQFFVALQYLEADCNKSSRQIFIPICHLLLGEVDMPKPIMRELLNCDPEQSYTILHRNAISCSSLII
jgi:hypothetical protein